MGGSRLSPTSFRVVLLESIVWTQIRALHQLGVVRQMYLWMVVVPILVRFLSQIPDVANVVVFGQSLTLELSLPFSWKLFYFAAICFVASNIIYHSACPRLVKDHPTYARGWIRACCFVVRALAPRRSHSVSRRRVFLSFSSVEACAARRLSWASR